MGTPYQEEANLGILRHVGRGERILDVGAGRGRLGEAMRARGNMVHGVELDKDAADAARGRLDFVHQGDATDLKSLPDPIRTGNYDTIVLADVLEHLVDPQGMLCKLRPLLKRGGRVLVSLPNVATWPMRLRLLTGDFTYGDSGILDRTHLRFFTRASARALLMETGFAIADEDVTPNLVRAALPLIKSVMTSGAGTGSGTIADSPAYQLYARFVEPVEARVARVWPELLAFQIVLIGVDL